MRDSETDGTTVSEVTEVIDEASPAQGSSLLFWLAIAAAAIVIVIGIVFGQRFGSDPKLVSSPLIGQRVASLEMPYLETDGTVALDALRGDILVINFWASWCFSCRVEHEALLAGAAQLDELGVTFIGVNHQDQPSNAMAFLDELGRSSETIYVEDVGSRVALEFGVLGLPETFFVDRSGIVVGKVSGPVSLQLLVDTVNAIVLGEDIGVVKTGEVQNRDS